MNVNTVRSFQTALNRARTSKERASALNSFKALAIEGTGWQGHPKATQAFDIAYTYGHAGGLQDVVSILEDLRVLVD